jgi:hypothetical protein
MEIIEAQPRLRLLAHGDRGEQSAAMRVSALGRMLTGGIPMARWVSLIILALGGWTYLSDDPVAVLRTVAELGGVIGLFTLVCASEAWT